MKLFLPVVVKTRMKVQFNIEEGIRKEEVLERSFCTHSHNRVVKVSKPNNVLSSN